MEIGSLASNHQHCFNLTAQLRAHTVSTSSKRQQAPMATVVLVASWADLITGLLCFRGGHQDAITGIDSLMGESCITSGGRDNMVIVYVIPEEKQLQFSSPQGSIDGVKLVNEKTFITFGQNG